MYCGVFHDVTQMISRMFALNFGTFIIPAIITGNAASYWPNTRITPVIQVRDIAKIVKTTFEILGWYQMTECEMDKLYSYIKE